MIIIDNLNPFSKRFFNELKAAFPDMAKLAVLSINDDFPDAFVIDYAPDPSRPNVIFFLTTIEDIIRIRFGREFGCEGCDLHFESPSVSTTPNIKTGYFYYQAKGDNHFKLHYRADPQAELEEIEIPKSRQNFFNIEMQRLQNKNNSSVTLSYSQTVDIFSCSGIHTRYEFGCYRGDSDWFYLNVDGGEDPLFFIDALRKDQVLIGLERGEAEEFLGNYFYTYSESSDISDLADYINNSDAFSVEIISWSGKYDKLYKNKSVCKARNINFVRVLALCLFGGYLVLRLSNYLAKMIGTI
jgi:hypothetical protein